MIILMVAVALTCCGLVMVYSASSFMAAEKYHDASHFLKRQAVYAFLGFGAMYAAMRTKYKTWRHLASPLLFVCIFLLLLVFVPGIGGTAKGAVRWIRFPGFNFQPSELTKIVLVFFMARSLDKRREKVKSFSSGFLPYMVLLTVLFVILLKQHDLGAALTLWGVAFAMLFLAGARLQYFLGVILLSMPFLVYAVCSESYRLDRIKAWIKPSAYHLGEGFQIIQSKLAMGSGGIFGLGLGAGKQKFLFLPEAHTDFILAVVGEELGLIGVVLITAMFFLLISRGIRVALGAPDNFARYLAFGIATLIGIEAFVNMGVVTAILPTKGLALPFISYGGSSLVATLFATGVLLNISSRVETVLRESNRGMPPGRPDAQ
jgi:cell division protein FtsW